MIFWSFLQHINDDKNTLNYTSLVCWQDQEAMKKAGANINKASQEAGIDILAFQKKHGIKVVNRVCSELPVS